MKFDYGTFWWNPGTGIAQDVNLNPADVTAAITGRIPTGTVPTTSERRALSSPHKAALAARCSTPPRTAADSRSGVILRHELMPNFALHFGYVYRRIDNLNVNVNANRPFSA